MAALPIIAAAPRPLEHLGREYLLRPMTLHDWAELEAWVAFRYRQIARRAIQPADPLAGSLFREIDAQARALYLNGPAAREIVSSAAGQGRLAWYHVRRDQPSMDATAAAGLLEAPGVWELLLELEETLSVPDPDKKPREPGPLDFRPIYRLFATQYNWPPDVVGALTLAQTLMYLGSDGGELEGFDGPKDIRVDPATGRKVVRCSNMEEASALIAYLKQRKETKT